MENYGFADEHSNLITYEQFGSEDEARAFARKLKRTHGFDAVEFWLDVRNADGELPESEVV